MTVLPTNTPISVTLTEAEREVLARLTEAHNLYVKLPVQHPSHAREWEFMMHQLQRTVMARVVSRQEGWEKK